jgi:hypothetical protein
LSNAFLLPMRHLHTDHHRRETKQSLARETIGVHDSHSHTVDKSAMHARKSAPDVGGFSPPDSESANDGSGWWSSIDFSICARLTTMTYSSASLLTAPSPFAMQCSLLRTTKAIWHLRRFVPLPLFHSLIGSDSAPARYPAPLPMFCGSLLWPQCLAPLGRECARPRLRAIRYIFSSSLKHIGA